MTRPPLGSLVADGRRRGRAAGHGAPPGEIAADLAFSPATGKMHVSRAMSKLHARDRIVVFAYESGLVVPGLG